LDIVIANIRKQAKIDPDKTALVIGNSHTSYRELVTRIENLARIFIAKGIRPGERVVVAAPDKIAFVCAYFATHLAGGTAVPINPHAPRERKKEIIDRTRPDLIVEASSEANFLEATKTLCSSAFPALDENDVADIMFTTGTTGRAKGVCLTHSNIATAVSHINSVIGTRSTDIEVVPIPLYHSFGLGRIRCCLSNGATIVLVEGFRLPGEIFLALSRHEATGFVGVPAGFSLLLRFGVNGLGRHGASLRYIEIGSAPMVEEDKNRLMALLPSAKLFMHYGLTEASRSSFIEFHRDSENLTSVGRPSPGVAIEVRDEKNTPCGPHQPGMLWISGGHVSRGYWDDEELSLKTFLHGWVRTGDVGYFADDELLFLCGRADDMINIGGYNVFPEEVESVLIKHPSIVDAACVGVDSSDAVTGQLLRAYLVAEPEEIHVGELELENFLKDKLEPYKFPTEFRWVSKLPRTASGKLQRSKLRKSTSTT